MDPRDRLINIATLACAAIAWVVVAIIRHDPGSSDQRPGGLHRSSDDRRGIRAHLDAASCGCTVFSRHGADRLPGRLDAGLPTGRLDRASRWRCFVLLKLENAFSLPIALFVLVLVGVAEATLSVDR